MSAFASGMARESDLVGRAQVLLQLSAGCVPGGLLTLAGPGGMGKTTLARALANSVAKRFCDGNCFVDFATLPRGASVSRAVTTALQVRGLGYGDAAKLAEFLAPRQMLLLMDNCEHLVDDIAELVACLRAAAPEIMIIATSQEPLRVPGERVHRLQPLDVPTQGCANADEAMSHGAVELFISRARRRKPGFQLDDAEAGTVAMLCRRLDGVPLAIELVAARMDHFELLPLVAELEHRLMEFHDDTARGREHHHSVRSLLDWSFKLLDARERSVLCQLAIFRGAFTLSHAQSLLASPGLEGGVVPDAVATLVAKSLISRDPGDRIARYRLLSMTRAYALAQLAGPHATPGIHRNHALCMLEVFRNAEHDWATLPRKAWLARYGPEIEDVHAALSWAFDVEGDAALGIQLTFATIHLAFQFPLMETYRTFIAHALDALPSLPAVPPALEIQLRIALGELIGQTVGGGVEMANAYRSAMRLAQGIGIGALEAKALDGLWMGAFIAGDYVEAQATVERCAQLSIHSTSAALKQRIARMMAQSHHFGGRHSAALALADSVLVAPQPLRVLRDSSIDVQVSMRVVRARILWLSGFADHAAQLAQEALELGLADVPAAATHALAWGSCPIAFWSGDGTRANALALQLLKLSRERGQPYWHAWGRCFEFALTARGSAAPASAERIAVDLPQMDALCTFTNTEVSAASLARARSGAAGWCTADLLRAYGDGLCDRLRAVNPARADAEAEAEACYRLALQTADARGELAWQLRAATSLARLEHRRGRDGDARATLGPVYGRFSEGFGTADLRAARALLLELGVPSRSLARESEFPPRG